jgi:hypothetical protein
MAIPAAVAATVTPAPIAVRRLTLFVMRGSHQ